MRHAKHLISLDIRGPFRIEMADGTNVTPKSTKAQALMAMLAVAPHGTRSRAWIKSKLWSTRAPEQAAGSLRQCLLQIRRALRDVAQVVSADRQNVTLDLKRVKISRDKRGELLEGIAVFDDAFEAWLHDERKASCPALTIVPSFPSNSREKRADRKIISIVVDAPSDPMMTWFVQGVADRITRLLGESFSVDVRSWSRNNSQLDHWRLRLAARSFGASSVGLRVALESSGSKSRIWGNEATICVQGSPLIEHPSISSLCNQLIEAVGDELLVRGDCEQSADRDCRLAIRSLFRMQPCAAKEADRLFANAYATSPRGLYLAWRAQCLTITKAERYSSDPESLTEHAEALCAQALEMESNNSMVLATVANTYGQLFKNHMSSYALAKRAVALNPGNPMAWWALSSAAVYVGDIEASLKHAMQVSRIVTTLPNKFWWDNQLFGSALVSGKLKLALAFAEECHAQNPTFKPPLRYLIALYAHSNREHLAEATIARLTDLEPDFSVERLMHDQKYPASLIHKSPGLKTDQLRAFM